MTSDNTNTQAAIELDDEGRKLQLEAEKAKYLETIVTSQRAAATSKAGALRSLLPTITDAPRGEVTLGASAGALGPWRAHAVVDTLAGEIASAARKDLPVNGSARVLVVDDRSLLPGVWTGRHVNATLQRLTTRLAAQKKALEQGRKELEEAIEAYDKDGLGDASKTPPVSRRRGFTTPDSTDKAGATPDAVEKQSVAGGAFGAAIDLLGLLRTDYTVTATAVTAPPAELSTLTAARLAGVDFAAGTVELDAFSALRASPTTDALKALLDARDNAVDDASRIEALLAPVEAETASLTSRSDLIEKAWATAVSENKDDGALDRLRTAVDALTRAASLHRKAAEPTRILLTHAKQLVAEVDAAVSGVLQAPDNSEAPILTAIRRERLESTVQQEKITHVLYVKLDSIGADAISRRSILGTSSRIRFLSAANASWLLLDTSLGTIAGGGQAQSADVTTFGLESGKTTGQTITRQNDETQTSDPLDKLETTARRLVIVFIVLLFVIGVLSLAMSAAVLVSAFK